MPTIAPTRVETTQSLDGPELWRFEVREADGVLMEASEYAFASEDGANLAGELRAAEIRKAGFLEAKR